MEQCRYYTDTVDGQKFLNSSHLKSKWLFKNLFIFFITRHVGYVDGKNKLQ